MPTPTPHTTVRSLYATTSGNVSPTALRDRYADESFAGPAIEAGGRIVLGAGVTSVEAEVLDADGVVLHSNIAITASVDIDPVPRGIRGPLTVEITNIAGGTAITTTWSIKV